MLLAVPFLIGPVAPALAEITFCNNFDSTIYIAVAWQEKSVWRSSGWLDLSPNECYVERVVPNATDFYYHAETDWIDIGQGKKSRHRWGKGKKFSVADEDFEFKKADKKQKGGDFEEFSGPIEVSDDSTDVRLNVVEDSVTTTTTHH
jgi:uncharacterized membrane protein